MDYINKVLIFFPSLLFEKVQVILFEVIHILDSNKFGLYLAIVGICLNIMDHYNKRYSDILEEVMLSIFNKIKIISLVFVLIVILTIVYTVWCKYYSYNNFVSKYWSSLERYQDMITLIVASGLVINILIAIIYIVDLWKDNKVTAAGLLFTATGFYFEMKEVDNFHWIALGVVVFTILMIISSMGDSYKR